MYFGKLIINNFFRIKHAEVDLSSKGVTYVEGQNRDVGKSNESGKTTIFSALSWCLFNKFPGSSGRVGDEIVNPLVGNDCYVELEIFDNSDKIVVKRTRKEGPKHDEANLYVTYTGSRKDVAKEKTFPLSQKDMSDSTKYISRLIGLDFETFTKQAYFAQEGIEFVSRMKDAALKQFFLENVLDIEWTQIALARAKDEKGRLEALILQKQTYRENARRTMGLHCTRLAEYRQKIATWEQEEDERIQQVKNDLIEALDLLKEAKKSNKETEQKIQKTERKHQRTLQDLQKKLDKMAVPQDFTTEIEEQEKQYRVCSIELSRYDDFEKRTAERIARLEAKVQDAEGQIGEKCESCGTMITKKHLPFMVQEIEAEIISLRNEMEANGAKRQEAESRLELIRRSLEESKDKREGQKGQQEERTNLRVEIAQLESKQERELNDLREELLDLDGVNSDIEDLKEELDKKKENPFASLVDNEKKELKDVARNSRDVREEIGGLRDELGVVEFWVKGFSGSGIQSHLLSAITPMINRNIANYMQDLSHGRIVARLHTVKKLKSGEYRENFHNEINNLDGGKTFGSLSSGAKRRVDLAIGLAVADLKRSISHKNLKFLVLDEASASLDSYWESQFFRLVKKNFSDYSCFLISHKEVDNSMFDRKLTVIKKNGETRLEG